MNRDHLDQDAGMLFIFEEEDIYPFWMKNTLIPLDIIWLNKEKEVVFISHNTPPCKTEQCPSYNPKNNAKYVFEINSGTARDIGLEEGNVMRLG